ncbi:MAG: RNA repair domain-containing protein [Myxococcota bacterium]
MGLRPAHEVYHRLRWDPSIDETTAEVVVHDRRKGAVAIPFVAFDPNGDIPWSRVQAFRLAGTTVWDRERRVDRVFGSGSTPGARLVSPPSAASSTEGGLRLLTLNVLFDRYDPEVVRTSERTPRLLALIRECNADLVALQEVEPWLCARLVEAFGGDYHLTDDGSGTTCDPYGQILMTKAPLLGVQILPQGGHKRHVLASVAFPSGRTTVAVVHLSSDRHADAPDRRARQLDALRPRLGLGPALVLGDLNQDGPVDLPLDDAWQLRHPDDPGYTWDPTRNALARWRSQTGARRRLDRIFIRGFQVDAIELVAVDHAELPLSDHHGLLATVRLARRPVQAEAWVLPFPPEAARVLEPLRRRFDPGRFRWPPHLTVAKHPTTPIAPPLNGFITLTHTLTFAGPPTRVVARLDEAGDAKIQDLRDALGEASDGLPHVTLGQSADPAIRTALDRAVRAQLPLRIPVTRLAHWSRANGGPMRDVTAPPSAQRLEEVLDVQGLSLSPNEDLAPLVAQVAAAASAPAHLIGSACLGGMLPEGDVDIVVRHPDIAATHRVLCREFQATTTTSTVEVTRFIAMLGTPPLPRCVEVTVVPPSQPGPEAIWQPLATRLRSARAALVLRALKGLLVARQCHDPAWGFIPGLALAQIVADVGERDLEPWLIASLERLREVATQLSSGAEPALAGVRFVMLPAVARTLVDELERALLLAWDREWAEAFESAWPDEGPKLQIDLGGPDPEALSGWLRGRIAHVLTTMAEGGSSQMRLRPYPRPVARHPQTLRYTIRWARASSAAVTQAITELHERFARSSDRPPDSTLHVAR